MVAAFVPARRAAKVPPVAAMRDDLTVQEKGIGRAGWSLGTIALRRRRRARGRRPGRRARHRRGLDRRGRGDLGDHRRRAWRPSSGSRCCWPAGRCSASCSAPPGRLAGENALRNPRRTGATASALMIGLAVVSAVGVLASSLSATNDALVDDEFRSDFLVQSPTFQGFPTKVGDRDGARSTASARSRGSRARWRLVDGSRPDLRDGRRRGFFEIYELDMVAGTAADDAATRRSSARVDGRRPRRRRRTTLSTWRSPGGRPSTSRSSASSRTPRSPRAITSR